jgi:hypothetical protein
MDLKSIIFALVASSAAAQQVIVVEGSEGSGEFLPALQQQTEHWTKAAKGKVTVIVPSTQDQLQRLEQALAKCPTDQSLWLAMHGHGSFDGRSAKFNLAGDDVSADRLAALLKPRTAATHLVLSFSSSGAFMKVLVAPQRIIVCSTQSGTEQSYSRFGIHFAEAIAGHPLADLDQDGAVSLLEAFLSAAKATTAFYDNEGRICTEHAILDDNGDGVGTRSEGFTGTRRAKPTDDGVRAHQANLILSPTDAKLSPDQRAERDRLEQEVQKLIDQRAALGDDAYFKQLEPLFLKIAQIKAIRP